MQKLANLIKLVSKDRWQIVPTETVDTLQAEIDRLEKHLLQPLPRPQPSSVRLIELQKFLDMAG
jgi:hypothetical protein